MLPTTRFTDPAAVEAWDRWFRWRDARGIRDRTIDATWWRVARAIASTAGAAGWAERYADAFSRWQLLPDERLLKSAGTGAPMPAGDSLSATLNVASFVVAPRTARARFDRESFAGVAGLAVRLLDDALLHATLPLHEGHRHDVLPHEALSHDARTPAPGDPVRPAPATADGIAATAPPANAPGTRATGAMAADAMTADAITSGAMRSGPTTSDALRPGATVSGAMASGPMTNGPIPANAMPSATPAPDPLTAGAGHPVTAGFNPAAFHSATFDPATFDPAAFNPAALDPAAAAPGRALTAAPRLRIGVLGLADALQLLGAAYDSSAALEIAAQVGQALAEGTLTGSVELARERGARVAPVLAALLTRGRVLPSALIHDLQRYGLRHGRLTAIERQPRLALLANRASDALYPAPARSASASASASPLPLPLPTTGTDWWRPAALTPGDSDPTLDSEPPWLPERLVAAQQAIRAAIRPWIDAPIDYPLAVPLSRVG